MDDGKLVHVRGLAFAGFSTVRREPGGPPAGLQLRHGHDLGGVGLSGLGSG